MTQPLTSFGGRRYVNTPANGRFELTNIGQRSATFQFELVDNDTGQVLQNLTPLRDSVPTLSHNTTQTIKRQVSLSLGRDDTAVIDTIHHRVRISMLLPDGTTWPLGKYMLTDNTRALYSSGRLSSVTLMDEAFIIDQPMTTSFGNVSNAPPPAVGFGAELITVQDAIRQLLDDLGIVPVLDSATNFCLSSWTIGTHRAQILEDLCTLGGYFSPWYGNDERLHIIQAFDPATAVPDFDFDMNNVVISGSISEQDDLLTAPNRIFVISNTPTTSTTTAATPPVFGQYDIPSSAPHSIQNRGFVIPNIVQAPVSSGMQAYIMAQNLGIRQTIYERVTLNTPPDPRFDSYDVVRWQDDNWLELSWTMQLIEGGTMQHTLRKSYL